MDEVEPLLQACGFQSIQVVLKEESKDFIKNWLPGSNAEQYVVSANITARKPGGAADVAETVEAQAEMKVPELASTELEVASKQPESSQQLEATSEKLQEEEEQQPVEEPAAAQGGC